MQRLSELALLRDNNFNWFVLVRRLGGYISLAR